MQPSSDGSSIPRDEHDALAADIACRRCAYNLRGLREDGRCPECGSPIGLSTHGDLLRFADPDWLDKVALGLKIILWMILVHIVARVAGAVIVLLGYVVFAGLLSLTASIGSFIGVWLMTEPDPSGIGEDPNLTARKAVRITLFLGLAGELTSMIAQNAGLSQLSAELLFTFGSVAIFVSLGGEFAKFLYYAMLAARVPDHYAERRARSLMWAYPGTTAFIFIVGVVMRLTGGTTVTASGGTNFYTCIMAPAGIALLVFAIMTLLLLLRLRRVIADAAQLARNTWAAADYDPVASDGSTHSRG